MTRVLASLALFFVLVPLSSLRLDPLPEVAATPGPQPALTNDQLMTLSFVLSGTDAQGRGRYEQILKNWTQQFLDQDKSQDESQRAESLLKFLHTKLRGYVETQTRVDTLIDRGLFNCVSSAVVYMILGRQMGLNVEAVATADHAFALVKLSNGREIDVETTTPYGYDPGTKTEFTNAFGQTGFAYVPPGNYRQRRTIDARQLLGLLLQNRMADDQKAGRPDEAVGRGIDRWVLEASPEARATLVAGFTNYVSWLNSRRQYQNALDTIEALARWTDQGPESKDLAAKLVSNTVVDLLDKNQGAEATALVQKWQQKGLLATEKAQNLSAQIVDRSLTTLAQNRPYTEAAAEIQKAGDLGQISIPRRDELLGFIYGRESQRVAQAQGPAEALKFLSSLSPEVQKLPPLVQAGQVYLHNWTVDVHNQFARMWNAGQKDQARALLNDALAKAPESTILLKDKASIEKR